MAKYQLKWAETKRFFNRFPNGKQQQMNAFIPIFFSVKAVWPDHIFSVSDEIFQGHIDFQDGKVTIYIE